MPDAEAFWGWCLETDTDKPLELLAIIAGVSVNAVQRGRGRTDALRQSNALSLAIGLDMAKHWTSQADGFFGRMTKTQLAAQSRPKIPMSPECWRRGRKRKRRN